MKKKENKKEEKKDKDNKKDDKKDNKNEDKKKTLVRLSVFEEDDYFEEFEQGKLSSYFI